MENPMVGIVDMVDKTLKQVMEDGFEHYAERTAIRLLETGADGKLAYEPVSYAELRERVHAIASGLARWGLRKGQRVGILTDGGEAPLVTFLAGDLIGVSSVPLCLKSAPEVIAHNVNHSRVEAMVVDHRGLEALCAVDADLEARPRLILTEETENADYASVALSWDGLMEMGRGEPVPEVDIAADDECKVLYTSGSSGMPKGVVQTQGNIVANLEVVWDVLTESDVIRMFKSAPDYHSMGVINIYLPLAKGWVLDMARSPDRVLTDIRYSEPEGFLTVPLILDKVYGNVRREIEAGGFKGRLIATVVAAKRRLATGRGSLRDRLVQATLGKRIIGKIKAALAAKVGANLKLLMVGSAKADPEALDFFQDVLDIVTFEGYGATECAPLIATNHRCGRKTGSVGRPLFEVDLRTEDGRRVGYSDPAAGVIEASGEEVGELLVHGRNVMLGYLDDPEQTARALVEEDGKIWYRTGDLFSLDEEGFLTFRGRLGRQFKLRNGEFVNPELLERVFARAPLVDHVLVCGDQSRSFPMPLVAVDMDEVAKSGDLRHLQGAGDQALRSHPEVAKKVRQQLLWEADAAGLPAHERPQKVVLMADSPSEEDGTLTRGLKKIVPKAVTDRYREAIAAGYEA